MFERKFYTRESLKTWQDQKFDHSKILDDIKKSLTPLQTKLTQESQQIASLRQQKLNLQSQINNQESHFKAIAVAQKIPFDLNHTDIPNLQSRITQLDRQIISHEEERAQKTKAITELNHARSQHEDALKSLHTNEFLQLLSTQPQHHLDDVTQKLSDWLDVYDIDNCVAQSENEKLLILELRNTLNGIKQLRQQQEITLYNAHMMMLLEAFYGCIASLAERFEKQKDCQKLLDKLHQCIGAQQLLPAESQLSYMDFQAKYPNYFKSATLEDLKQTEVATYEQAVIDVQGQIDRAAQDARLQIRQMGEQAQAVLNKSQACIKAEPAGHADLKYLGLALQKTARLMIEPGSVKGQADYQKLIKQQHLKQPSVAKKISGCLLAFLGGVVVAASFVAHFGSCGLTTPLTAVGIGLGSGLFFAGLSLLKGSGGTGMKKEMNDFQSHTAETQTDTVITRPASLSLFKEAQSSSSNSSSISLPTPSAPSP